MPTVIIERMTAWTVFWAGTVLEVVGLAVGAVGFRSTWHEFSTDDRFFREYLEWIKPLGRRAKRFVRRVLRPKRGTVLPPIPEVGATIKLHVAIAGGVGSTGLPSPADDPGGFAAEVEARFGRLHSQLHTVRAQLEDEAKAREAADQQLLNNLDSKVASVEGLSRQIAVGGLRAQVFGWSCVALGFTIQAIATPFV
jgi:hypothetical protein